MTDSATDFLHSASPRLPNSLLLILLFDFNFFYYYCCGFKHFLCAQFRRLIFPCALHFHVASSIAFSLDSCFRHTKPTRCRNLLRADWCKAAAATATLYCVGGQSKVQRTRAQIVVAAAIGIICINQQSIELMRGGETIRPRGYMFV